MNRSYLFPKLPENIPWQSWTEYIPSSRQVLKYLIKISKCRYPAVLPVGTHHCSRECQTLSSHSLHRLFVIYRSRSGSEHPGHVCSLSFSFSNQHNEDDTWITTRPDSMSWNSTTRYRGRSLRCSKKWKHQLFSQKIDMLAFQTDQ